MTERICVHYNLHRGDWVLSHYKSPRCKGNVMGYRNSLVLRDCTFVVQEGGRQRVVEKKCRQVHAWVTGLPFAALGAVPQPHWPKASYNPYRSGSFHFSETNEPLPTGCDLYFHDDGYMYLIKED